MLNTYAIGLAEGETFVIQNNGRTFTPNTDTNDLKIADFPSHLETNCPENLREEIQQLIEFNFG